MSICTDRYESSRRLADAARRVRPQRAQGRHAHAAAGGRGAGVRRARLRGRDARRRRRGGGPDQGRGVRPLRLQGQPAGRVDGGVPRRRDRRAGRPVRPRRDHVEAARSAAATSGCTSWTSSPDAFRLLVEFWVAGERDERLRERFAAGLEALRQMFAGFVAESAADAGLTSPPDASRHFANVVAGAQHRPRDGPRRRPRQRLARAARAPRCRSSSAGSSATPSCAPTSPIRRPAAATADPGPRAVRWCVRPGPRSVAEASGASGPACTPRGPSRRVARTGPSSRR